MSGHWPQRKQELICVKYSSEEIYLGGEKIGREGYFSQNLTQGNQNELNTGYKPWLAKCLS